MVLYCNRFKIPCVKKNVYQIICQWCRKLVKCIKIKANTATNVYNTSIGLNNLNMNVFFCCQICTCASQIKDTFWFQVSPWFLSMFQASLVYFFFLAISAIHQPEPNKLPPALNKRRLSILHKGGQPFV